MISAGLITGIVIVGFMLFSDKGVGRKIGWGCLLFILLLIVLGAVAVGFLNSM